MHEASVESTYPFRSSTLRSRQEFCQWLLLVSELRLDPISSNISCLGRISKTSQPFPVRLVHKISHTRSQSTNHHTQTTSRKIMATIALTRQIMTSFISSERPLTSQAKLASSSSYSSPRILSCSLTDDIDIRIHNPEQQISITTSVPFTAREKRSGNLASRFGTKCRKTLPGGGYQAYTPLQTT